MNEIINNLDGDIFWSDVVDGRIVNTDNDITHDAVSAVIYHLAVCVKDGKTCIEDLEFDNPTEEIEECIGKKFSLVLFDQDKYELVKK